VSHFSFKWQFLQNVTENPESFYFIYLFILFIYLCSFDPREGYCPQDVEHVIINVHNTM